MKTLTVWGINSKLRRYLGDLFTSKGNVDILLNHFGKEGTALEAFNLLSIYIPVLTYDYKAFSSEKQYYVTNGWIVSSVWCLGSD